MGGTYVSIAAASSADFIFKLPLGIADNYILKESLRQALKIRITFDKNISETVGVGDNELKL